ncbi:MAG: DUF3738 domain-containing protein [Terracidiphilus sp.]
MRRGVYDRVGVRDCLGRTCAADAPPPLVTAMQEQLGLKLDSEKTSVDVMVIDQVDHPSPN